MIALLSWRVWAGLALAIGLAVSHFTVYRAGKASVRAEWTAEKLAQSEAARQREKGMTIANQGVDRDLQAEKKRRIAAESRLADGLRDFTATLNSPDPVTPGRVAGTGGLERELLGQCANNLAAMAQTADRLEGKVVGLQSYVGRVCLMPSN